MTTRAKRADHGYEINGRKRGPPTARTRISTPARTGDDPREGVSCSYVPGHAHGLTFGVSEHKMGLNASPTTALYFDAVTVGTTSESGTKVRVPGLPCPRWILAGLELRACEGWLRPRLTWQRTIRPNGAVWASDCGVPGLRLPPPQLAGR